MLLLSTYIHSLRTSLRDEPTLKDPETLRLLDSPGLFTSPEREALATDDVEVAVTQLYFQLVGGRALRQVAERTLVVARQAHVSASARHEAGLAPIAEVARAEAEVHRAEQSIQEAELAVLLAERNLANLTGVELAGRTLPPIEEETGDAPGALDTHLARLAEAVTNVRAFTCITPTCVWLKSCRLMAIWPATSELVPTTVTGWPPSS